MKVPVYSNFKIEYNQQLYTLLLIAINNNQ